MKNNPDRLTSLGPPSQVVVSLHDIGQFPSSNVATQVAENSDDFCALRLCCKAAYGAEILNHSSNSNSSAFQSTSQTGLSRQTTHLHLASRVFLERIAASDASATPCQATQLLSHHPAVNSLLISQPSNFQNPRQILLHPVPDTLSLLLKLSIFLRDEEWLQHGMADVVHMEIDTTCIARLHCLTHLTLHLCSLGPGFSEILAQLALLTVLNLDESKGVSTLTISNLPALQLVSMVYTDVSMLTITNCKALDSLDPSASHSLVSCIISGCLSLTIIKMNSCRALPRLDVRACAALERLDVSDCSVLTELLASGCCKLSTLHTLPCAQLAHLDIRGCSKLEALTLSELTPEQLDPSVQAALKDLTVQSSELSLLPLLPQLQKLDLYDCSWLSILDLASHGQLRILSLESCDALASLCLPSGLQQLTLNHCSDLLALDMSQLAQLQQLVVHSCNTLQLLDVSHLSQLTSLVVQECNSLTAVFVSNCHKLSTVNVVSSCLSELSITHLPLLIDLKLTSPSPGTDPIDVTVLQVQLHDCPSLINMTAKHTGMTALDVSSLGALQKLDTSGCTSLLEINAAGCPSLKQLILSGCSSMQRLHLTGTTSLRSLSMVECKKLVDGNPQLLDGSTLLYLHLSFSRAMPSPTAYTYLTYLHAEGCSEMTAMDLSIFPNLRTLILTSCTLLDKLDVTPMQLLRILTVKDCTSLTDIGGAWPEGITRAVSQVFAGGLPDDSISQIRQLHIINCPLQVLDLAFFPYLKELSVKQCSTLLALELQYCRGLKSLKMDTCNAISKLDVSCAFFLSTLELRGVCSLLQLKVEGCGDLQSFHLSDAAIADLDVRKCHCLRSLDLGKLPLLERIIAVGLASLSRMWVSESPKLRELHIAGSTARLDDIFVGPESQIATLDLTRAPLVRDRFLPADRLARCAVCLTGAITHAFLHPRMAHCVCSTCVQKVSRSHDGTEGQAQNALACLVCSAPCQLAQIM